MVRLLLHLASVWLWLSAITGLVWIAPKLDADPPEELLDLQGLLRSAAELAVFALVATGVWSAMAVRGALDSPPYSAKLLLKGAALVVSGLALTAHQRRGPTPSRTVAGTTAIAAAVLAAFLGVSLRT